MKKFVLALALVSLTTTVMAQSPALPGKNTPVASPQTFATPQVSYTPRVALAQTYQVVAVPQIQVAVPQIQVAVPQIVQQSYCVQQVAVQQVAVQQVAVAQCQQVAVARQPRKVVTKTVTKVKGGGLLGRLGL